MVSDPMNLEFRQQHKEAQGVTAAKRYGLNGPDH